MWVEPIPGSHNRQEIWAESLALLEKEMFTQGFLH